MSHCHATDLTKRSWAAHDGTDFDHTDPGVPGMDANGRDWQTVLVHHLSGVRQRLFRTVTVTRRLAVLAVTKLSTGALHATKHMNIEGVHRRTARNQAHEHRRCTQAHCTQPST